MGGGRPRACARVRRLVGCVARAGGPVVGTGSICISDHWTGGGGVAGRVDVAQPWRDRQGGTAAAGGSSHAARGRAQAPVRLPLQRRALHAAEPVRGAGPEGWGYRGAARRADRAWTGRVAHWRLRADGRRADLRAAPGPRAPPLGGVLIAAHGPATRRVALRRRPPGALHNRAVRGRAGRDHGQAGLRSPRRPRAVGRRRDASAPRGSAAHARER